MFHILLLFSIDNLTRKTHTHTYFSHGKAAVSRNALTVFTYSIAILFIVVNEA